MTARRTAFGLHACPDCTAVLDARQVLAHDTGCPVAADADAVAAADREWFEAHPGQHRHRRPVAWSETVALSGLLPVLPEGARWVGFVTVTAMGPGVRARNYSDVRVLLPSGVTR